MTREQLLAALLIERYQTHPVRVRQWAGHAADTDQDCAQRRHVLAVAVGGRHDVATEEGETE